MKTSKKNRVILTIVNLVVGVIIIGPLLYAVSLSFMTPGEISQYPPKLVPSKVTLENYHTAINSVPLFRFIVNSFVVSILVTIGQVFTASLASFAFAFYDFKGKKLLFLMVLSTMMIPGETTIISNFLTVSSWGWTDSLQVLIVPFLTSAMGIFLIRQFYLTLPKDLIEAARIDGCTNFMFLIKILIPISKPAIASLSIYTFISTWNQYLWPLLTINNGNNRTVQIGISMLQFAEGSNYGVVLAGAVLILIPSILVFSLGQKSLVQGMTAGSVKG
ncbi:carbohydrate ABC transporter permease [Turicibacter sanguinis]|uniref:carbohydrate ABC transporter permease n=1 Tax=Turicibacter sanguinis TaxID=154288 RepID=UPI0006C4FAE8|nr:carbohydrate ABC transporter permease [Turicibacter sanguinis]MDB8575154.1 carbohydrate ABC transporter permease [Turicibacter sanguinis]MDB8577902.1 carbohydrate ABC transporter permease [Turicibacter sanguinis]MDB8583645.1 carbohydrate ABC transporter permease [Turicibacter sanguinis]MDB8586746.1 carbohydrate ABC transporter permease [Turicibacter sanguinis]MDB8597364.1 carbohydrate ABC transporter permease [Turicibacter sanguinis]